jgi:phosphoribosylformimino-5-aminoimidazole carboxamide ribotide isomerase
MNVVPTIDVRGGKVVRLKQGLLQEEKVYGSDPVAVARRWEEEGAPRLHVVDLDAALGGKPQFEAIAAVIAAVRIPVEVGGGLRVLENAMRYREYGADRVIFGTAAVADPGVVQEAARRWPGAVAVALDARNGKVAVAGWKEITRVDAVELAGRVKGWGVARLQYTDVMRDGTLTGPNLPGIEALARQAGVPVTAGGGISVLDDIKKIAALEPLGVDEVVVGKALYEQRFTLAEAREAVDAVRGERPTQGYDS